MRRPCIVPGCPKLTTKGSRCPEHRAEQRAKYGNGWQAFAARAVTEHVAMFGHLCPGWRRPAHPSRDLTLDHVGDGTLQILCRSCNSRKVRLGDG